MTALAMRQAAARTTKPVSRPKAHSGPASKTRPKDLKDGDTVLYRTRETGTSSWGTLQERVFDPHRTRQRTDGVDVLGPESPIRTAIMGLRAIGEETTFLCRTGKRYDLVLNNIIDG